MTVPCFTTSFAGQIVIVTGSDAGLDRKTAEYIVCLNAEKFILAM